MISDQTQGVHLPGLGTSFANNAQPSTFSAQNIQVVEFSEKRRSIWINWYPPIVHVQVSSTSSGRPFWILSRRVVQTKFNMTSNSGRQPFLLISDLKGPCHSVTGMILYCNQAAVNIFWDPSFRISYIIFRCIVEDSSSFPCSGSDQSTAKEKKVELIFFKDRSPVLTVWTTF